MEAGTRRLGRHAGARRTPGPAALLCLLVVAASAAAAPPPGTRIENRASAAFVDAGSGSASSALSKAVGVVVAAPAGADVTLAKSADDTTPAAGQLVVFTLAGENAGDAPAQGVAITLDGGPASAVLLHDALPPNTRFDSIVAAGGAAPLYHLAGAAADDYVTTPPPDLADVDALAFALGSLAPGASFSVSFALHVQANASGSLVNAARARWTDAASGDEEETDSNLVTLVVSGPPPSLAYYLDAGFTATTSVGSLGLPLFVGADAAQCNADPLVAETHSIVLVSELTGDVESFLASETAANSGVFRILPPVPTRDGLANPVVAGNGILEALRNDVLTASLVGCGAAQPVQATLLIDPRGVVFDGDSNAPLAGATVTLIDVSGAGNGGSAGGAARVFLADGTTPAPSTVVTGADGAFEFPLVLPSRYRLEVTPPAGYTFPSTQAPAQLPPGRNLDASGSYGGAFDVTPSAGAVIVDVPLDPDVAGALFVQKRPSRDVVEIGELVDYTLEIRNDTGATLSGVRLDDSLPAGFRYRAGSARLGGAPIPDPEGGAGPSLRFALGPIGDTTTVTLSYRVRVGPGALQGDGVNRARAASDAPPVASNLASALVRVAPGVFRGEGYVVGKVFADLDRNGLQGAGEPGIPGVRLFLEDGTFVGTDEHGKYSLYGVRPRTHVLKVDRTTLPAGARLAASSNRHAGDPGSRFVDLQAGELHKADFAETSGDPRVLEEIAARAARFRGRELEDALSVGFTREGTPAAPPGGSDPRGRAATGIVGEDLDRSLLDPDDRLRAGGAGRRTAQGPQSAAARLPAPPRAAPADPAAPPDVALEALLPGLEPGFALLEPRDGSVLGAAQTRVRAKGAAGARFELFVNGRAVPEKRVGKKSVLPERGLEAWEWVGVALDPGVNRLELVLRDAFGNPRERAAIEVRAPGRLARFELGVPEGLVPADGSTPTQISVAATDADGVALGSPIPITLEASLGEWEVEDLDPLEPGVQSVLTGPAAFVLRAAREPGEARIRIGSGRLVSEGTLRFVPELRPLIAAGIVEGVLNLRKLDPGALEPARRADGFEEELRNVEVGDGKTGAGARASLFLKGRIRGDALLTVSYDSEKGGDERLFRDIQPHEFYPVYGDASERGFDAQSTSKLYVRVDKERSFLLFGDYTTPSASEARKLGAYGRSLTGLQAHLENDHGTLDAFASRSDSGRVIEEIPARGLSGPYRLSSGGLLVNGEQVEIVTRDRNQPSLVLASQPQSRFSDYEIEPLSGEIFFRRPIPSVDSELNPIFIRVTYEVEQGGEAFWVTGANAELPLGERLRVGAGLVEDMNPQDESRLYSTHFQLDLGRRSWLVGELARSEAEALGAGNAGRLEWRHEGPRLSALLFGVRTDEGFENLSSGYGSGRLEAGTRLRWRFTDRTALLGEGLWSEDIATSGQRRGALLGVEHAFDHNIVWEVGARWAKESLDPAQSTSVGATPFETTSLRTKLTLPVPKLPDASVFGEYEQDVRDSGARMAALGGEYRIANRAKLYARHELLSSLGGPFSLNGTQERRSTAVGVDWDYLEGGNVFSEYRVRDVLPGREGEVALGLRHGWEVTQGLHLQGAFERIHPLTGGAEREATALSLGLGYTRSEDWKGTTRLELRTSNVSQSVFHSVGAAARLDETWSLLARNLMLVEAGRSGAGDRVVERLQLGTAYRDARSNRWNALLHGEFKYEQDAREVGLDLQRRVGILSTHVHRELARGVVLSGRLAAKLVQESSNGVRDLYPAQLVGGRLTWDLTDRWDAGLQASTLLADGLASQRFGLGGELGYRLWKNLWASAGYNVFGFEDEDLVGQDYTNPGAYLRLRFKFDEDLLSWLDAGGPAR